METKQKVENILSSADMLAENVYDIIFTKKIL